MTFVLPLAIMSGRTKDKIKFNNQDNTIYQIKRIQIERFLFFNILLYTGFNTRIINI